MNSHMKHLIFHDVPLALVIGVAAALLFYPVSQVLLMNLSQHLR